MIQTFAFSIYRWGGRFYGGVIVERGDGKNVRCYIHVNYFIYNREREEWVKLKKVQSYFISSGQPSC